MEVAEAFRKASKRLKDAKKELKEAAAEVSSLEGRMLDLMEAGKLPESFRHNGASIYTREEIWASPADGNHQAVVEVLESLDLHEYLPSNVNSQSISAYVRGFRNEETGELEGLPTELEAVLKITRKSRCIASGVS